MTAMPDDWTPLPRGLEAVQPIPAEQGGGLLMICDCGTSTQLVIDIEGALAEPREIAFTCDGCQSVHWLTLTPPAGAQP